MLLAGTYKGKIKNWGIKWYAERDEYKAFIVFEIEGMNEDTTWFGSLDPTEKMGKTGKPYSFLNMTKRALKDAGFKGDDPSDLITLPDALPMGKEFSVTLTDTLSKDGKKFTNTNFAPLGSDGNVVARGKGVDLETADQVAKLRAKLGLSTMPMKKTGTDEDVPF